MTEPRSDAVHYGADIKPLFRESDRRSMTFAFDLWSFDDVVANADGIAERLRAGDMPCDGRWPDERVALFEAWIRGGMKA